jgi:hypothetical protein|tara:strand:- start:117 stop:473 length:357 start_codon:yes stop_codon:yes gene_type:complete
MRELIESEINDVNGGIGLPGAFIGAAVGALPGIYNKAPIENVAAAALLGALSGATGNFAGSAAAGGYAVRLAWGLRSVGLGVAAGEAGKGSGNSSSKSLILGGDLLRYQRPDKFLSFA